MANSIIVVCARLFLALLTEGVALFYFLLSDVPNNGSPLDEL